MSNLWFTADTHEGHGNIIKYCGRPFKDTEEQHAVMVKNFNARVKPEDTVICNGDYCFKNSAGGKKGEGTTRKASDWQKDYVGNWIYVKGNHDGNNSLKTPIEKMYLYFGGKYICVVHNPVHADPKVEINIVGHIHTEWKVRRLNSKSIMVNVGVDAWGFKPVSFDEIMKRIAEFKRNELQKSITIPTKEKRSSRDRQGNIEQSETPQELQSKEVGEQVVEG